MVVLFYLMLQLGHALDLASEKLIARCRFIHTLMLIDAPTHMHIDAYELASCCVHVTRHAVVRACYLFAVRLMCAGGVSSPLEVSMATTSRLQTRGWIQVVGSLWYRH